jgi:L-ribulokinase
VYAWLKHLLLWPLQQSFGMPLLTEEALQAVAEQIIPRLSERAQEICWTHDSELSVDWFNGRRTPNANGRLKGCISGLHLGSDAPRLFYSLVEATCFGAKAIVDRFEQQGIPVKGVIAVGGVARKSPFIMQMMADVLGRPIRVHRSEQTCALGAAMFAATAAGIYPRVEEAMKAMGPGFEKQYTPADPKTAFFQQRYKIYQATGQFLEGLVQR